MAKVRSKVLGSRSGDNDSQKPQPGSGQYFGIIFRGGIWIDHEFPLIVAEVMLVRVEETYPFHLQLLGLLALCSVSILLLLAVNCQGLV